LNDLCAGEAGAVEALLRFLRLHAGGERTRKHLLPAFRRAPSHRQIERSHFSRHRRRSGVGSKGRYDDLESFSG
jgi:hypothetical protein